jgi:hypothetical protein
MKSILHQSKGLCLAIVWANVTILMAWFQKKKYAGDSQCCMILFKGTKQLKSWSQGQGVKVKIGSIIVLGRQDGMVV